VIDSAEDERRWSSYMAAAHRGDARLYERLLDELATVIERYITRRFGALSFTEDCVQECLLAIHHARHTYDPSRPFRPWLFAIVRNKTIDLLRRSYAREPVPSEPLDEIDIAAVPTLDTEIDTGNILGRLKPQFRRALTLTKVFGYSVNEAAERTGISEAAMKSRVSRAIKAAESLLKEERDTE
jgi:RNA polymerase sigma-70 factor, ECF subfamily